MDDQPGLDDAIVTATKRMKNAQIEVAEQIDGAAAPELPRVEEVVRRAEDLKVLSEQAAHPAD